jgi:CBS domain-containing protein
MHDEGITSLPVLDNQKNVVGNISHVDVKVSFAFIVLSFPIVTTN